MALISVVEVVVTPTTMVSVIFKWFHLDANIFSCKPPTSSCLQRGCCNGEALIKTEHFLIKRKTRKQHCRLFFAPGRLWQKFHQTAWYIVAHCREAKQVKCHLFHRNVDRNSLAVTNNLLTTKDVWINSGRGSGFGFYKHILFFCPHFHYYCPQAHSEIQLVLESIQLDLTLFTVSNHTKAYKPKGDKLPTVIILPRLTHVLIHFIFFFV